MERDPAIPAPAAIPAGLQIVLIFAAVFLGSLLGIWSRPVGFLANVWPANALMLGLLLRLPRHADALPQASALSHMSGAVFGGMARAAAILPWAAGAAGFVLADLLTGAPLQKALLLNLINLAGIWAAWVLLIRQPAELRELRAAGSIVWLLLAALAGGAAAGLGGALANPLLFGGTVRGGFALWGVTEMANYVTFLPAVLSLPPLARWQARIDEGSAIRSTDVFPALAVLGSCLAGMVIGGPGGIALPVLALLWCGLVYPVFPTALLTLLFGLFAMWAIAAGYLAGPGGAAGPEAVVSIRLGVAAVALVPVLMAIVSHSRNEMAARLRDLARRDPLTGIGNRGGFAEDAAAVLASGGRAAMLVFDLDHFKQVNDSRGHAAGDEVLRETVRRAALCLRAGDVFGRIGGEEFAVLLRGCTEAEAVSVAERIRQSIAAHPVPISGEAGVAVSASLGLATVPAGQTWLLEPLLAAADAALYAAKRGGRNRLELAPR